MNTASKVIQELLESSPKLSVLGPLPTEARVALCQSIYDDPLAGAHAIRLPRSAAALVELFNSLARADGDFVAFDDATLAHDVIVARKGPELDKAVRAAVQATVADPLDPVLFDRLVDALLDAAIDDDWINDVMSDYPGNAVRLRRAVVDRLDDELLPKLDNADQLLDAWNKLSAVHKAAVLTDVAEALAS